MPEIASKRTTPRRFVSEDFNPTDPQQIATYAGKLQERDISSVEEVENFILDWEELGAVLYEAFSQAYVDMTADTANKESETHYLQIIQEVLPVVEPLDFELKQKLLRSPAVEQLGDRYEVFLRNIRSEVEIFREENVPLQTEERTMDQEFEKIVGGQMAQFRGKEYTIPQLELFFQELDRDTREEAWRARAEARLADADKLDELYDRMYEARQQIARNAGFDNFRDYQFRALKRFDYTPEDCLEYHEAIEKHVVPVVLEQQQQRREMMGLDTLRPWDVATRPNDPMVDPDGSEPLRPFDTVERLVEGSERVISNVDAELGSFFRTMVKEQLLDLENRPGKAPGAYMTAFPDMKVPYMFMNAVGTKRDVETVLHEGGHAFHYFLAREQPLHSYHHTGSEFSEVASMSMEFLARPFMSEFYAEEDLNRIHDDQIVTTLSFLPFMAMIDAFQHWVYTDPVHDAAARKAKWAELENRFRPAIDWSGLEQYRDIGWQYPHVFSVPFYYIEYGIAQLAALRIWLNSLENREEAVKAYKRGLALGGSRPLPELFKAAGAEFSFNAGTVGPLVEGTIKELSHK